MTTDPRKKAVMNFIRDFITYHNRAPSLARIARGTGLPFTMAQATVRTLQHEGYLARPHRRSPMLAIVKPLEEEVA